MADERRDEERTAQAVRRRTSRSSAEIHTRRQRTDDSAEQRDTSRARRRGSAAAKPASDPTPGARRAADHDSGPPRPGSDPKRTKRTPRGSFRSALTLWATRPIAGIAPKYFGRAIIALLTVAVLVISGLAWLEMGSLQNAITRADSSKLGLGGNDDGATDILLVGVDSRQDAKGNPLTADELKWLRVGDETTTSTDTILLIRVPDNGKAATALSIPRDSYVDVPGIGKSKINAAYGATREGVRRREVEAGKSEEQAEKDGTLAGQQALIQSVANLTGVTVDHYAEIGLLGFALLTDAVGGVDVCLKKAVREPLSGARFKAGVQTLSGPKALSFVRQRHDLPRGDLDRITRQQVYMASLAQKVLSTSTLTDTSKLNRLKDAASRSILIDDDWDIFGFAEQLKDLSGGSVKFATIPVVTDHGWSDDGTQSVVEVDPAAVRTYVANQLGISAQADSPGRYTVDVVNAGTTDGLGASVMARLVGKGYVKGTTTSKPFNEFNSLVFAKSKDSEGAKKLVSDLTKGQGGIEIREDSSLHDDELRAVLTNTYNNFDYLGNINELGQQQETGGSSDSGSDTGASGSGSDSSSNPPAVRADTSGPVCVN